MAHWCGGPGGVHHGGGRVRDGPLAAERLFWSVTHAAAQRGAVMAVRGSPLGEGLCAGCRAALPLSHPPTNNVFSWLSWYMIGFGLDTQDVGLGLSCYRAAVVAWVFVPGILTHSHTFTRQFDAADQGLCARRGGVGVWAYTAGGVTYAQHPTAPF